MDESTIINAADYGVINDPDGSCEAGLRRLASIRRRIFAFNIAFETDETEVDGIVRRDAADAE